MLESVEHAHEDFTAKQLIEFRNKGEADVRHTERMLAEAGDLLSEDERRQIEEAIAAVNAAIAGGNLDALRPAVATLGRVTTHLAGEAMNAVVKKTLAGKTEGQLRAGEL